MLPPSTMRSVTTIVALLLLTPFVHAQKRAEIKKVDKPPPEVRLNVMIVDADNIYVNNVKREEIKVFEDGVEQTLTHFSKRDQALDLALVIDNSGSVRPYLGALAKTAAAIVENIGEKDEALVVRFISSDKIEVIQEWTADKPSVYKTLKSMYIEGGASAVLDGVYLAAEELRKRAKSRPNQKYALVLISDFEDRDSFYNLQQVLDHLAGTDIQIFTLALTGLLSSEVGFLTKNQSAKNKAAELADMLSYHTGGHSFFLDEKITNDILLANLKPLIYELRAQYVIGYKPLNFSKNALRKITIEVAGETNGKKRQAFARDRIRMPKAYLRD